MIQFLNTVEVDGKTPAPIRGYEGVALYQLNTFSYPLIAAGFFPSTVSTTEITTASSAIRPLLRLLDPNLLIDDFERGEVGDLHQETFGFTLRISNV